MAGMESKLQNSACFQKMVMLHIKLYRTTNAATYKQILCLVKRSKMLTLKGTTTLTISMFNQNKLYEQRILTQVSSKLVEKWGSNGHLKNSICATFSRHFEYLISF